MSTPIERAARDLYYEEANDSDGFDAWPEWESHDNPTRDIWRQRVRSALTAALDVDELALVINKELVRQVRGELIELVADDGIECERSIARAVVARLTKGTNDE